MKPITIKLPTKLYRPTILGQPPNLSRRRFVQGSSALVLGTGLSLPLFSPLLQAAQEGSSSHGAANPLLANPLGFNGERKDPLTGLYHLGKGYRAYNPVLMRFQACDSMSPFGKGGINSYAYCLGDPINLRDPSGHFALMSLLIGVIVGAAVGAAISATTEGLRAAMTHTSFDWKQVGIGAALGAISGGFGAAAQGTKVGVQVGLTVADFVGTGAIDTALNNGSVKDFGIGVGIGLVTFGVGARAARGRKVVISGRRDIPFENLNGRYTRRDIDRPLSVPSSHAIGSSARSNFSPTSRIASPYNIQYTSRNSLSNSSHPSGNIVGSIEFKKNSISPKSDTSSDHTYLPFDTSTAISESSIGFFVDYYLDEFISAENPTTAQILDIYHSNNTIRKALRENWRCEGG